MSYTCYFMMILKGTAPGKPYPISDCQQDLFKGGKVFTIADPVPGPSGTLRAQLPPQAR